jgi:hypothetical protein
MRPSRLLFTTLWVFTCIAIAHTAAAQNPFTGTWKMNQEKSQLAGDTMKFIAAEGDALELAAGGTKYSFRPDGKSYGLPSGNVAIWRQTSPDSWSTEYRKTDGKLLSIDAWKLSPDGNTLSVTTSGAKANGDLYTDTVQYVRTAGTSGLTGSWKSTEVKLSSPNELTIQESGLDHLILKIAAIKASCEATLDGKDATVSGPDLPSGLRLSLTRTGPYSFRLVQKLNGTPVSSSEYTVSADGNTMTEVGGAPGDPPATVIWERQAPEPKAAPKVAPNDAPKLAPDDTPKPAPTIGAPLRPEPHPNL